MVTKVGIIGFSKGNGHPFSFSAILNGYSSKEMQKSGWGEIQDYLDKKDSSDFGISNALVTHVWCQNRETSVAISKSCFVENVVDNFEDMIGEIDAVIIARDDYKSHFKIAKIFLENGLYVFVDKPLTLNIEELSYFKEYLEKNQLMSCSGFRYCIELDNVRHYYNNNNNIKLINSIVINDWEKYGVHMLDAVLSFTSALPISVKSIKTEKSFIYLINMDDGSLFSISTVGSAAKIFSIQVIDENIRFDIEINDNFRAFKRTLSRFIKMANGDVSDDSYKDTLISIKTLIAGKLSRDKGGEIFLEDLTMELKK
jgi:hypothetical protein